MKKSLLILGFFDGIHIGHRNVIKSAVEYARKNDLTSVLLTFSESPAEYFKNNALYIYPRETNYRIIKNIGVDVIREENFANLVNISAKNYINDIVKEYAPQAIFTGFNYTFGAGRYGNSEVLKNYQSEYRYEYYCIPPVSKGETIISSTLIKNLLNTGNIIEANKLLVEPFTITSTVIHGAELGRKLGFPTANMQYPNNIVKVPFGVYKVTALNNQPAILNWGIKPTIGKQEAVLEVHIPGYNGNLYGKELKINILEKIREEKTFNSLEELTQQIKKDTEECLK